MPERVRVGIVGCGAISGNYLKNGANLPILEFVACADLVRARAEAKAEEFGVPRVLCVDELIADPDVEVVLNLTVPAAHAPLCLQALEAGKHVYVEKPLGVTREEGAAVVAAAAARGLLAGCAPDTFLGAGLQTARKLLDDGTIGRPVAFTASFMSRGPEQFHPDPAFFYRPGGGPMLDMGPYYVTALLNLLGPVSGITAGAGIAIPRRVVGKGPRAGESITVTTPDHVCAVLETAGGAIGTLTTSFAAAHPPYDREFPITIYGEEGTLRVPDPNLFDGRVLYRRVADEEWIEAPHTFVAGYGRSVGLADLACAVRSGRAHRVTAAGALAALEVMLGSLEAAATGKRYLPPTPYSRPVPMPAELPFGTLDW